MAGEEVAAVLGLARGAGRRGQDLVDLVRAGDALELRERLERRGLGRPGQLAPVETARAEPDHFLLPIDDLEREVGAHADHDHVDRVRADVDGGQAHGSSWGSGPV